MTDNMEQATIEAARELYATELAYCRAAANYAGFIYRHSNTPEERIKWRDIHNKIVEQYKQAQIIALKVGEVETGEAIPSLPVEPTPAVD